MPVLQNLRDRFEATRPLAGARVAIVFHLTAEAAALGLVVAASGAETMLVPSKVATMERATAPELEAAGIRLELPDSEERRRAVLAGIPAWAPDLLIDNADLFALWHGLPDPPPVVAASVHSRSACDIVDRHVAAGHAVRFPVMAVGSSALKLELESRFGTGQSVLSALIDLTGAQLSGKSVAVIGYGNVGAGFAAFARGVNARVTVVQNSPYRALKAVMEGFEVRPLPEAIAAADVVITATGSEHVLTAEHFPLLRDGAYVGNVGRNREIDVESLAAAASVADPVAPAVTRYVVDGKQIYLMGDGHQFNHMAGSANSAEMMDISLALHAFGLEHLWQRRAALVPGVFVVPDEIAAAVADAKLAQLGVHYR